MFCSPLIEAFVSTNAGAVAFVRTSYSNEYRYKSPKERLENICPPTVERAMTFLEEACLKPAEPHRCLLMQPMPDIKECGIGLKLFFFSLLYFAAVFLVMAFVSIGQLALNYENNYYGEKNINLSTQLGGSIGGVAGLEPEDILANCSRRLEAQTGSFNATLISELDDTYNTMKEAKQLEVTFDAAYTVIFMISIVLYAVWTRKIIEKNRTQHPTLADFSLKFTQLPESRIPRLLHFLESCKIQVHDVSPIRHINKLVLHIKYIKQFYKSQFLQMLVDKNKKCTFYDFVASLKKRDELEMHVRQEEKMEVAHSAVIVFKTRAGRQKALSLFRKNLLQNLLVKLTVQWMKWRGRTAEREEQWLREVNVKSIPTPEDMYWENIRKKRWLLRIKLYLLAAGIILLSSGIIFALKVLQNRVGTYTHTKEDCYKKCQNCECPFLDECLCIVRGENCENGLSNSARVGIVQAVIGFTVILVNSFLPRALSKISSSEKQSSKPRRKLSTMMKIFVALLINTSFVILVVNAKFQDFEANPMLRLEGKGYNDFSRDWYAEVGISIMISMLFSIFTPHFLMCLYHAVKKCYWRCMLSFFDTQLAYNNWVIGSDIDLPLKIAMQMVIIFTCFIYSGGIPWMLLICACALFAIYVAEKYMLRYYDKPNERSTIMHAWQLRIIPWAIVIHCLFSIYMYGSEIFPRKSPSEYMKEKYGENAANASFNQSKYLEDATSDYDDRVKSFSGIVFLTLAGIAILLPIISYCIIRRLGFAGSDSRLVTDAMLDGNFFGGKSYQISDNLNYREVVQAMYEVGASPEEEADIEAPTPEILPTLLGRFGSFLEPFKPNSRRERDEQDLTEAEGSQ